MTLGVTHGLMTSGLSPDDVGFGFDTSTKDTGSDEWTDDDSFEALTQGAGYIPQLRAQRLTTN